MSHTLAMLTATAPHVRFVGGPLGGCRIALTQDQFDAQRWAVLGQDMRGTYIQHDRRPHEWSWHPYTETRTNG